MAIDKVCRPCKVLCLDVYCVQRQLNTIRLHLSYVTILCWLTTDTHGVSSTDKVVVATSIDIECEVDTVVQETSINTEVKLVLLLISEVLVSKPSNIEAWFLIACWWTPWVVSLDDCTWVSDWRRTTVGSKRVAQLSSKVRQYWLKFLKPRLLVSIPCTRQVPCRQPTSATALTHTVCTLITICTSERITTLPRICSNTYESCTTLVGIFKAIVVRALLLWLLKHCVSPWRNLTHVVLHTPTTEPCSVTLYRVNLHSTIEVYDMVFVVYIIISSRCTEVVTEHAVVGTIQDTTIRKDGYRERIDIVWVCIQIVVILLNCRVTHCTICCSLVRIILDIVLVGSSSILNSTKSSKFNLSNRLVWERCLHTEVYYVEVDIVILQLMEDVEWRIVTSIICIRVKSSWRVQCIRIRVDIECTANLTCYRVCCSTDSTRSLLLTIRSITDNTSVELLRELVVGIEVSGVTLYLALVIPSWIVHRADRSIVLCFLCTSGDTYRVVVLNRVREQLAEPVCVTILCVAKICSTSLVGVGKSELTCYRIVSIEKLIHLTIYTTICSVRDFCIVQETLLLQLLVYRHLILRVHNIKCRIAWLQTHGVLTSIANLSLTSFTLLSGNNDHTSHSTSTINRSSRTILQDFEAFDIIRVKACDSRADKSVGISRWQLIWTYVYYIFHNHTIDNPKRLWATVDRCSTTHANLWCCTKCTRYVLYWHTGSLSFEWAANVGNTINLSWRSIDLRCRTREQSFVYLHHTSNDNLVNGLRVCLKSNLHVAWTLNFLSNHTNIAYLKHWIGTISRKREVTINVGYGTDLGALNHDRCTDNRLTVFCRDNCSRDFVLSKHHSYTQE